MKDRNNQTKEDLKFIKEILEFSKNQNCDTDIQFMLVLEEYSNVKN
jgi:hypothetical protein